MKAHIDEITKVAERELAPNGDIDWEVQASRQVLNRHKAKHFQPLFDAIRAEIRADGTLNTMDLSGILRAADEAEWVDLPDDEFSDVP